MTGLVLGPRVFSVAVTAGIGAFAWQQSSPAGAEPAAPVTATYGSGGGAYNIRVMSDASPDLTDLEGLIHSTTSRWPSSREKVWALFYWSHLLKRQTPPIVRHGVEVTDPIRNFADFGFTMCSTISGINQTLYEALGLRHQYWDICNHTVSAVDYEDKFRMIDSSMSNLVTTDDGTTLASLQEAVADSARLVRQRSLYSTSPNGFLSGTDYLRNLDDVVSPESGGTLNGFADAFCESGLKFRDYYNWSAGHRYVLNLRDDESYTRYYRRLGTGPDFYVASEKIADPNPGDTFENDPSGKFGNRGNGSWSFTPKLSPGEWERAVYSALNVVAGGAGLQPATAAVPADVIYKVQAANAMASQNITAQLALNSPSASAIIAISLNHGQTWVDVAAVGQQTGVVPVVVNLRDQVNGAYETLIRFRLSAQGGGSPDAVSLTALRVDTVTHLNIHALPRLNIGRNEVFVGLGRQTDTMVLWPDLRGSRWRNDAVDSFNIGSQAVNVPRNYTAVVYPAVVTQDAFLTYRLQAPADLTRAVYGGRLYNTTPGSYIEFLHSFDEGSTWIPSYRLTDVSKPNDVIHYETVTNIPAGVRAIRFKFRIHSTGTSLKASGLYAVRMEASHQPSLSQTAPVEVTLRWKEVQADRTTVLRTHKQLVDRFPTKYVVNVGGSDHPIMESMTMNVESAGDGAPAGYSDGTDRGGTKYVYRSRTDGTNLAHKKRYTVSRPSSQFQYSAPPSNTTLLTDGVVGAPATGSIAYWWGQCWTANSPVDLQIDLGSAQTVRAFRAHLLGYPARDALKSEVQDRIEIQSSADGVTFVSHGLLQTSLWKKDIPINHMLPDDGKATAWNFERTVPSPVAARYVRYRITPKRHLCATELQVLDRVEYQPFDIRIALPAVEETPSGGAPPSVALTSPRAGVAGTAPATITLAAAATDPDDGVAYVQFFANGTPVGTDDTPPYTAVWAAVSDGDYTLTAVATDSSSRSTVSAPVIVTVASRPRSIDEIVLHAAVSPQIIGGWTVASDVTAASGARLQNPNANLPKVLTPLAMPTQAFELTFEADAYKPYRLWLRGKALSNSYNNDSVYVQFDNSVTGSGSPIWRIGTPDATTIVLEDCSGCGVQEWGWADNGYGLRIFGPLVYFASAGPQRLRVQAREDGLGIDQLVLSAADYLGEAPGVARNDGTLLPSTLAGGDLPPPVDEVVMHAAADAQLFNPAWFVVLDPSAAGGARLQNSNANAAKRTSASADTSRAFDLSVVADAGRPYRLWVRGKAENDSYNNDSIFVQFDSSVDALGVPMWRIGTTSSTTVVLEQCGGCGLQGWGWTDNGYDSDGPPIYFARSGPQRLRIQVREDGMAVDQVLLSAVAHRLISPGSAQRDSVILPK